MNVWHDSAAVLNFDKAGRASEGKECFLINSFATTATTPDHLVFLDLELHRAKGT
jgi:hypothetical protein